MSHELAVQLKDCKDELQLDSADETVTVNGLNTSRPRMRTRGSRKGTNKKNYAEVSEDDSEDDEEEEVEDENEQSSEDFTEKSPKTKISRIVISSGSEDFKEKIIPKNKNQLSKKTTAESSRKRKSSKTIKVDDGEPDSASNSETEEPPKTRRKLRNRNPSKASRSARRCRIMQEDTSSSSESEKTDVSDVEEENPKSKLKTARKKRVRKKGEKKARNTGRKKIKKIIGEDDLLQQTKEARREEEERLKRLQERHQSSQSDGEAAVLGSPDNKTEGSGVILQKEPLVQISPYISKSLRPHQIEGVRFIWDNLIESTERCKTDSGGGCILAHCMGLGKTLQTIASVHTFLKTKLLNMKCVMVVAPLNTVRNWVAEFVQWCEDGDELDLYSMAEARSNKERMTLLRTWRKKGGVLITGYDMYRIMTTRVRYKGWKDVVKECLVNPGPDIVICDEGHMLKNASSNISTELNKVKTRRRLVLTGTPLQNNLIEYHCMVSFVKPDLLGSLKEFRNRFVNPIVNGQHTDSTAADVNIMKRRSHVLHEMLSGFVQRKDYSVLKPYLSSKFEYVLKVRLTPLQIKLYQHYLDTMTNRGMDSSVVNTYGKGASLFSDYQNLMRVWTHPKSLLLHTVKKEKQLEREAANNFLTDEEPEEATMTDSDEWQTSSEGESDESSSKRKPRGATQKDTDKTEEKPQPKKERKHKDEVVSPAKSDSDPKSVANSDEDITPKKVRTRSRRKPMIEQDEEEKSSKEDEKSTESSESESEDSEEEKSGNSEQLPSRSERLERRKANSRKLRGGGGSSEEEIEVPKEVGSNEWYSSLLPEDKATLETFQNSSKITLLFEILKLAEENHEKVLLFSQSLVSLDLIEMMLATSWGKVGADHDNEEEEGEGNDSPDALSHVKMTSIYGGWYRNIDYFRMDGSTLGHHRQRWINAFNDEDDHRSRLFLISTRAGSLGVNLVGANRVIIFDSSWNPSHDTQSIFRVYRFGQTRACYIYRFIAEGTMEEKIYQRQVNKQSLAIRVVDEQQINRHFTASSLAEMYTFNPTTPEMDKGKPTPVVPKDQVLAEMLSDPRTRHLIASYHEHDSLLDHQVEEELTEEERKAAWEEYEMEKKHGYAMPAQPDMARANLLQQTASSIYNHFNPQSSLTMMAKVNKMMQDAYIRVRSYETKPIKAIIAQLRTAPLYANSDEEMLQTIAREVNQRLTVKRNEAQAQFETLQMHYKSLQQQYFKNLGELMGVGSAGGASKFATAGGGSGGFAVNPITIPSRHTLLQQMGSRPPTNTLPAQNGDIEMTQSQTTIQVIELSDSEEKQSTSTQ